MAGRRDDPASRPGDDNPEWTAEDFANARPASEVLPNFIGEAATQELMRLSRGRLGKPARKAHQTLRLDPDVVEAFQREGADWQARINDVLRAHMPGGQKKTS